MTEIISNNYILFSLLGLLGVYLLIYIQGLTGSKKILRVAWLQYIFVIVLLLSTLSSLDEYSANDDSNKNKKIIVINESK